MRPGQRPDAIDTRVVLRTYAGAAGITGLLVYGWPMWLVSGTLLRGVAPLNYWAIVRVGAALLVASAICAAGLARLVDPVDRRRALYAFAAAHLAFGSLFYLQWFAIFDAIMPAAVGWAPLLTGALLLYVAITGIRTAPIRRLFVLSDAAGVPGREATLVDVRSEAMAALRSRYEEHIAQAARQEERTRLARDLHDAIKQQLFVVQMAAATTEARIDNDVPGARAALGQARTAAREAMTEMEAMIDELQAAPIENSGLVAALRRQCEALGFRTSADVQLDVGELPASLDLPPGTHFGLFRCTQEALANIGRHARAAHVRVSVRAARRHVELTVWDDGAGFDPLRAAKGMGLENMAARAAALNGSFMVKSAPGAGTTVQFTVPYTAAPAAEYAVKAALWSAMFCVGAWYLGTRGVADHPWSIGLAAVAAIGAIRHAVAYARVRGHARASLA